MDESRALYNLVLLYEDAEAELLRLIRDAVASNATGTAGQYQAKADALDKLLQKARAHLDKVNAGILPDTIEAMYEALYAGAEAAVSTIPNAGMAHYSPSVATESIAALATEAAAAVTSQAGQVLRSVNDAYRQVTQRVSSRRMVSGMNLNKAIQLALNEYAEKGITSFVDSSGRRWGMDTYTRMTLRTTMNRATNAGRERAFLDHGIDLVRTTQHRGSHPWCVPYQGRILALSGDAGTRTVQDRTTGEDMQVDVTATMAEAVDAGYHHPNCRHSDHAYIPGFPIPEPIDLTPEAAQAEYDATQRQRQIERNIRHWKRREAVATTPGEAKRAKAKVRAWQKSQRDHIAKWPHLSRDYSRERVWAGDARKALRHVDRPYTAPQADQPRRRRRGTGGGVSVADILARNNRTPAPPVPDAPKPKKTPPKRRTATTPEYPTPQLSAEIPYTQPTVTGATGSRSLKAVRTTTRAAPELAVMDANHADYATWGRNDNGNCVRVSTAFELRRRGYDVVAGKGSYKPNYDADRALGADIVRAKAAVGGPNTARAKVPYTNSDMAVASWRTKDGNIRTLWKAEKSMSGVKGGVNAATLRQMQDAMPDGARGFANGRWKTNGGHIWNWEKIDGEIVFWEGQSNKGRMPPDKYLDNLKTGSLRMVRVDDMEPTDDVLLILNNPDN